MRGGSLLFCFVLFFPSPPIRSGEVFSSVIFSSLSLLLFMFLDVAMVWKGKPTSVCDHGFERSDLCAEIIIIIIIINRHPKKTFQQIYRFSV